MSDEEVAAARGLKSSEGLTSEEWTKTALKVMNTKAANNHEGALETLRLFKAAASEGVTRIRGEITIKSGRDQAPAVLEANIGGLG